MWSMVVSLDKYEEITIKLMDGEVYGLQVGDRLTISGSIVVLKTFAGECIFPTCQVMRIDTTHKKGGSYE